MPVTKSAKKKLRQDKKRTEINKKMKNLLKNVIKEAKKLPSLKTISKAAKIADKAAKLNIIHKKKIRIPRYEVFIRRLKKLEQYKIIKTLVPRLHEPFTMNVIISSLFWLLYPIEAVKCLGIDPIKYKKYIRLEQPLKKDFTVNGFLLL